MIDPECFAGLVLRGKIKVREIERFVEAWHAGAGLPGQSLPDYLGLSPAEYAGWAEDASALSLILLEKHARETGLEATTAGRVWVTAVIQATSLTEALTISSAIVDRLGDLGSLQAVHGARYHKPFSDQAPRFRVCLEVELTDKSKPWVTRVATKLAPKRTWTGLEADDPIDAILDPRSGLLEAGLPISHPQLTWLHVERPD